MIGVCRAPKGFSRTVCQALRSPLHCRAAELSVLPWHADGIVYGNLPATASVVAGPTPQGAPPSPASVGNLVSSLVGNITSGATQIADLHPPAPSGRRLKE